MSSCRGEAFIDALKSDTTIVLVAADDASGECTSARDATRIGATLFDALSHAESLQQALETAQGAVAGRGGAPGAKLHIGPEIATKLRELDRKRATRGASRTRLASPD